jgi:hypothetical protein
VNLDGKRIFFKQDIDVKGEENYQCIFILYRIFIRYIYVCLNYRMIYFTFLTDDILFSML